MQNFESDNLQILLKYFRKLKISLDDLTNFIDYEIPNSIEKSDEFNWHPYYYYQERIKFINLRINFVMCLGLIAKNIFGTFNKKAKNDLKHIYNEDIRNSREEIINNQNYSTFKDDLELIEKFIQ